MPPVSGQGSGDFLETWSRVITFHIGSRSGSGLLAAPDAFTQNNPSVVTASATRSTKLVGITKVGILGGSVVFTRPDIGNGYIGGAALGAGSTYLAGLKPLGIFINDANGNPYENAPGLASRRLAYYPAGTFGVRIWETQVLFTDGGATAGDPLTYTTGDYLYASANGLLTNRYQDAYQYRVVGQNDLGFVTLLGTLTQAPTSGVGGDLLVFDNPY